MQKLSPVETYTSSLLGKMLNKNEKEQDDEVKEVAEDDPNINEADSRRLRKFR